MKLINTKSIVSSILIMTVFVFFTGYDFYRTRTRHGPVKLL